MKENLYRLAGEFLTSEEAREARESLRDRILVWAGAICLFVLFLLAVTYPLNAHSEEIPVYVIDQHPGVRLQLLPSPCADAVSKMIAQQLSPEPFHSRWKASKSQWQMQDGSWKEFDGCWLEVTKEEAGTPDDVLFFTFVDGAHGQALKRDVLKKKSGA
jgi:hypothetical protein